MDPLISVIVPVYNVAPYLEQCLNSITKQTYTNLQIILIDDGSTDSSSSICDRFANNDHRIVLRHIENGGISHARNLGFSLAKGEFISFIDSDDMIHPDFYKIMLSALENEHADLVICKEQTFFNDTDIIPSSQDTYFIESVETQKDFLWHFMDSFTGPLCWVWNKLYRRTLLENISFQEGKKMEDIIYLTDCALKCHKIVWIKNALNYYRQWSGSTMSIGKSDITCDYANALIYSCNKIQSAENYPDLFMAYSVYITNKIALLCVKANKNSFSDSFAILRNKYRDCYRKYNHNIHSAGDKGKLFLARYCFPLYYALQKNRITI